jgi:heme exporter protein A
MSEELPPYSLEVKNLQLLRSGREILSDVSFKVKAGEALLLRGANGVGKTSLLMALAQYLHIEAGSVNWECKKSDDEERYLLEDMHFISHQHSIKGNLSLKENLEFWANLCGGSAKEVKDALVSIGLDMAANFDAALLSAGQKKRLSLGRLLVSQKPIWLLDEPTSALDSEGDRLVAKMIDAHLDMGGLLISATHLDLAMKKNKRIKTYLLEAK